MDQKPNIDINTSRSWTSFIVLSVIAIFCTLLNARVFHIVYIKSTLKYRPANILVAHLSAVVIGFTFVIFTYFFEKFNLVSLSLPGICNILSLLSNTIYNVFSLNIAAIVWVRTRKDAVNLGKRRAFRIICILWIIAVFVNLPSFFMVESFKHPDSILTKCRQINLFGKVAVKIVYDGFRIIIVNMMVCVYFLKVTFKLRHSLKYLQMQLIQTDRTMKQIKQVRFMQCHTILLTITWFPHGVGGFLYRMCRQLGWTEETVKYTMPLSFFLYTLLILCPISYVFLLENISFTKIFLPCIRTKDTLNLPFNLSSRRQIDPEAFGWKVYPPLRPRSKMPVKAKSVTWSKNTGVQLMNRDNFRLMEMSLLTTIGLTGTSGSLFHSMALMIPLRLPFIVQRPPIPTILRPATALRLEDVKVEMHVEPVVPNDEPEISNDLPDVCNDDDDTDLTKRNNETLV